MYPKRKELHLDWDSLFDGNIYLDICTLVRGERKERNKRE